MLIEVLKVLINHLPYIRYVYCWLLLALPVTNKRTNELIHHFLFLITCFIHGHTVVASNAAAAASSNLPFVRRISSPIQEINSSNPLKLASSRR